MTPTKNTPVQVQHKGRLSLHTIHVDDFFVYNLPHFIYLEILTLTEENYHELAQW